MSEERGGVRMRWGMLLAVFSGVALIMPPAEAGQNALLDKLVEKGYLTEQEAREVQQEMERATVTKDGPSSGDNGVPQWVKRWEFKGDMRLRNEYRDRSNATDLNRQRLRFRVGFVTDIDDTLQAGARLATGSTDEPVSTNDSFDDAFNKKPFNLDLAWLKYTPELAPDTLLSLLGGIIENPMWVPSALVWDADLSFDGAALNLTQSAGGVELFAHGGAYALDTDEGESGALWSAQGGARFKPAEDLKFIAGLAYHDYVNADSAENDVRARAGGAKGNTASVKDFNQINPALALIADVSGLPVQAWADYVHNLADGADNDEGYQLGLQLGKARKFLDPKHGWEAGYFFQRLEQDAVFGPFTDGDFGGGGTNHKGHVYFVNLATLKNSTLGVKYFDTRQITGPKNHFDTLQVDWVTKF